MAKDDVVRILDYVPDIIVDLKYATADNFTGKVIYDFNEAYLRYGTVMKLAAAQKRFAADGCRLVIWDAFRPMAAQFALWEVCPISDFVADPNDGYSNHNCGYAVDVTLALSDGTRIPMPTGFDDFSPRANRDYSECTREEAENARYLERVMTECGFHGYCAEWWHFSDTDKYGPVENIIRK